MVNLIKRDHYIAYVFNSGSQRFYYFDTLQKAFSSIQDQSLKGGRLSLLIYFRVCDKQSLCDNASIDIQRKTFGK